VKTIHVPPLGPEQVARLRALFTETGNRAGIDILQDYEDRITSAGGWVVEAAKSVYPSKRLFEVLGSD